MRWVLPTSLLVVWLCGARLLPAHRPVAAREEWRMPAARAGKDRALFFLVNEYNDPLYDDFKNPEGNPIKDGHAIAKLLREQYGFETEILENPSLGDIGDKINEYAARYLSNEWDSTGQLMIYFSGHGESVR
ncbi:MAG TPA: caspase family protein, partial [Saprospiraceae bacterium]|nr:caspase family protein [Saprospiraceae bacterium]